MKHDTVFTEQQKLWLLKRNLLDRALSSPDLAKIEIRAIIQSELDLNSSLDSLVIEMNQKHAGSGIVISR